MVLFGALEYSNIGGKMLEHKIIDLQNSGLNMGISKDFIFIRNGKNMLKYDLDKYSKVTDTQILKKDGKARSFFIIGNRIYLRDFCELYELNCNDMKITRTWKLGENLSSDISAETGDKDNIYACIRGGKITKIDIKTGEYKQYQISDSSIWEIISHNQSIYLGNLNGELIVLDNNMSILQRKQIHKKNIYSILVHKKTIYTLSQDKSLTATDINKLDTILAAKNAISNISKILGIYKDKLFTSNPNRNEITVWNANDLKNIQTIQFPTGGLNSNGVIMEKNNIYGSNNSGIYFLDIDKL
jgi:hypothetical protein